MDQLRRAAIWTVAIELPLAALALVATIPPLYRTVPLVLTAHLPGIALLDGLSICCGIHHPGFEPPMVLSILILALANAAIVFLLIWLGLLVRGWFRKRTAPAHS